MIDFNDDPEMLAAEYVLGVLGTEDVALIRARLPDDPILADAVAAWEKRLAYLADEVAPLAAPTRIWQQITASLEQRETPPATISQTVARRAGLTRSLMFWRVATAASLALAAGLAALLFLDPSFVASHGGQNIPYMTVLATNPNNGPSWVIRAGSNGKIFVTSMGPAPKPEDKDLELWAVARGETKPVSLGVLPQSGTYETGDAGLPDADLFLLVSIEPKGGSRTGRPSGPVVIGGELTRGN